MTDQGVTRKLTAIMSADVRGYSRLMADDEPATVRCLTAHREIIGSLVDLHHGRVIDTPGDNVLAEFASAVNFRTGRMKLARAEAAKILSIKPDFSLAWFAKATANYKDRAWIKDWLDALRQAGLK